MTKKRAEPVRGAAYWEGMSRAVEAGEYETPGPIEYGPAHLERGRPTGGSKGGSSPIRAIRLSAEMDTALADRAAESGRTVSELMREAVAEYLQRHAADA